MKNIKIEDRAALQPGKLLLALFCLILFTATPIFAQPANGRSQIGRAAGGGMTDNQRGRQAGMQQRFLKELNLNEDQKNALKDFRSAREDLRIEKQRLKLVTMELMQLLKKGASDDEVMKKVEQLNESMTTTNTRRAQSVLELRSRLTAEQFQKIWQVISHKLQQQGRQGMSAGGPGRRSGAFADSDRPGPGMHRGAGNKGAGMRGPEKGPRYQRGMPPGAANDRGAELEFSLEESPL